MRNALADLALRALRDAAGARAAVAMLAEDAAAHDPAGAALLVDVGLADPPGTALLAMYAPHAAHVRAHAARQREAIRAYAEGPAPVDALDAALLSAAALWRSGLFFEVHEVLEPHWGRARGALREALQGLIQVAVAFHHLAHENLRGARKLLADGRARLASAGAALPRIDAPALLAVTEPWLAALAGRAAPPAAPVPPLPMRAG